MRFEGQAPMELEFALADVAMDDAYPLPLLKAVHPEVVGTSGRARPLGGRPAGWETRETADWEVCGTKNPPTTSGGPVLKGHPPLVLNWRRR